MPSPEKTTKYKQRINVKAKVDTGLGSSANAQKEGNTKSAKSLENNQEGEKCDPPTSESQAQREGSKEVAVRASGASPPQGAGEKTEPTEPELSP